MNLKTRLDTQIEACCFCHKAIKAEHDIKLTFEQYKLQYKSQI